MRPMPPSFNLCRSRSPHHAAVVHCLKQEMHSTPMPDSSIRLANTSQWPRAWHTAGRPAALAQPWRSCRPLAHLAPCPSQQAHHSSPTQALRASAHADTFRYLSLELPPPLNARVQSAKYVKSSLKVRCRVHACALTGACISTAKN